MFWTSSCWYWRLLRQNDHAKSQALRVIQCYLKFVRFAVWSTESFFDLHHHFFNPRGPLNTIWEGYRHYEVFLVVQNTKLTISSGIFSFVFLLFPLIKLFKTGPKVDWGVRAPVYEQKSSFWPKANLKKRGNVSGNLYTGISTFTFFSQELYRNPPSPSPPIPHLDPHLKEKGMVFNGFDQKITSRSEVKNLITLKRSV